MLSIVHAQVLQWTSRALWFARLADLSPQADDIQMNGVVSFGRQQASQEGMSRFSAAIGRAQPQPPRNSIDMGIHRKGRLSEREL